MQKLMDLQQGSIVKLDGIEFKVALTTPQGVKVKSNERLFSAVFDSTNSSFFNPNSTTNLGHQLNTTWYNTLSDEAKSMIINATWNTGIAANESSRQVTAKVGLLTKSEWESLNIQTMGLLYNAIEWLITPYSEDVNLSGVYTLDTRYSYVINSLQTYQTFAVRPALVLDPNLKVDSDGTLIVNVAPTISINSPAANQTIHENGTLTMAGSTVDTDADDVVTVKYQVDSGTVRNLHSAVSDGTTPIDFSKTLTYKDGVLKDGNTILTSVLDKDVPHTVSMWAEDGKGGKSSIVTRTFFVVPNRPPTLTINPITAQSELINSNVINISGAVTDLDHNDVTVTFKINDGEEQQVYQGPPSAFTFNILLNDLKVGANTVIVKGTDIYNTAGTKTLTINKTHNATPVNTAVARYQIQAPTGSAKSILLWVTRTLGNLGITAEVSLTNGNDAENYVALNETNSAIVNGLREEEFAYQGTVDKEKIILKITYNRTDAAVIDTIKQISGVLF